MALDVDRLLAAPAGVTAEHAALTEPLAVGIRSVAMARYRAASGAYVVVGCGPIGLAVIAALRADGLGPIVAADLSSARLAIAEKLGADVLVDATNDNAFAHLGDRGFTPAPLSPMLAPGTDDDLGATIFDCVGAVGMFKRILGGAPPHSHIVFAGICGHDDTYRPMLANVKEVTVSYVLAYRPEELAIAAQRIADGKIDADSFITATVGLDEAPWAFDALSRAEHAKIVVDPTR
jgi:threonine dehydrogenase-like Zn-dependent dehydrogenase